MGNVLIIAKLYPAGVEEIKDVQEALKSFTSGEVQDVQLEPIAFGLSLVKVGITVPDKQEGVADKVEEELKKLKGVQQVEIEGVTLV